MNNKYVLFGSLTVSWLGTVANLATEAKSIFGALAALASLVASCYAVAAARRNLKRPQIEQIPQIKRKAREDRKGGGRKEHRQKR